MGQPPRTVARGMGVLGEIALRRRFPGNGRSKVHELILNGVFLMDTEDASSEERLAHEVARRLDDAGPVLVGGLGFGFTVTALLRHLTTPRVDVVEIEPLLVEWLHRGLVPEARDLTRHPRVKIHVGEVGDFVTSAAPASYAAIVLDVDNGPGFLVHDRNAGLYGAPFVKSANRVLRPGGVIAVWSADRSSALLSTLSGGLGHCEEVAMQVTRNGRALTYYAYVGMRAPRGPA